MTSYDPQKPHRRSIRLQGYDYSQSGAYFVTICTHRRASMFGEIADGKMELNRYGRIVSANWLNLPKHRHPHVELSAFAVMPNHIHGIVVINRIESGLELPKPLLLSEIVRGFKTFSARGINMSMANADAPVWQRNYWEHVIRNQEAFNRIHEYIVANPRRWHLDRENPERIGGDEFDIWINGL